MSQLSFQNNKSIFDNDIEIRFIFNTKNLLIQLCNNTINYINNFDSKKDFFFELILYYDKLYYLQTLTIDLDSIVVSHNIKQLHVHMHINIASITDNNFVPNYIESYVLKWIKQLLQSNTLTSICLENFFSNSIDNILDNIFFTLTDGTIKSLTNINLVNCYLSKTKCEALENYFKCIGDLNSLSICGSSIYRNEMMLNYVPRLKKLSLNFSPTSDDIASIKKTFWTLNEYAEFVDRLLISSSNIKSIINLLATNGNIINLSLSQCDPDYVNVAESVYFQINNNMPNLCELRYLRLDLSNMNLPSLPSYHGFKTSKLICLEIIAKNIWSTQLINLLDALAASKSLNRLILTNVCDTNENNSTTVAIDTSTDKLTATETETAICNFIRFNNTVRSLHLNIDKLAHLSDEFTTELSSAFSSNYCINEFVCPARNIPYVWIRYFERNTNTKISDRPLKKTKKSAIDTV